MSKTSKAVQPAGAAGVLLAVVLSRPFHSYFEHVARARFTGSRAARVRRAARQLPRLYWTCVVLDLLVRAAAVGLAAASVVMWVRSVS